MDYYTTLGIKPDSSQSDIKTAFRKKAMQHHPDRGGDETEFKKVNEAYDTLSDPQKKQQVDQGIDPNNQRSYGNSRSRNQSPFEFHFGDAGMSSMFDMFGRSAQRMPHNPPLSVSVTITLADVVTGKEVNAQIGLRGGKSTTVNIRIPPGIESGQQIRYQGMGDTSVVQAPPGDLIVTIMVKPDGTFRREGDNLVTVRTISIWEAMLGSTVTINTISGKSVEITIPKGTQPNQLLRCKQEGLPNIRSLVRGDMYVSVTVSVPTNLSIEQTKLITDLVNSIQ